MTINQVSPASYYVRVQDPNQPARIYPLTSKWLVGAKREAGQFLKGVLKGGKVEVHDTETMAFDKDALYVKVKK